jgi:xanthine dehydrogenase iron-sulfur cluster and FAD-binding subunit A
MPANPTPAGDAQAHRRDDDIAIVNAGVRLRMEEREGGWVVAEVAVAYGGVAPLTIMAPKARSRAASVVVYVVVSL